ncbi:protein HsdA [Photobacterium rosenbergii]|uniref:Protein HsdA n=1 Tax=Photobacterium rosenbergii TaxID=294936 RepID=A0A2T3NBY9_9GAMM|nr:restriction endonuclease subunit S [Photobacterium rosenbergii]PSW11458.1 protein HsdA [Photobacterium rosenbergii]
MSFDLLMLEELGIQLIDGDRGKNYPKKNEFKPEGHCLFLSAKNVTKSGFQFADKEYITEERHNLLRAGKLERSDIVLTTRGTIGNVAFYDDFVPDDIVRINSGMLILRADTTVWNPRFLYFLFTSKLVQDQIASLTSGSAVPQLPAKDLKKFSLPLIPVPTQNAVVKVIGDIADKLSLNSKVSQTLEEMAQAIFKSWFVDFDPVKAKMNGEQPEGMDAATASLFPEKLVESELGLIPEGWEATDIDNATSKVFSGGTPSTKNEAFWGGELPWFSSGETRNNFIIETEKHITQEGVDGSSTKASAYGDVLIASAGQGHTRGQTSFNSIDCYINQSVVALRASDNISPYWLYYCLERRYDEMRSVSDSHSSRGSLTTKLLKALPIARPSKEIVNAFDAIVESLVRKQVANAKQNKELSLLRDTLLPKLLSGEIELGQTEQLAEVS